MKRPFVLLEWVIALLLVAIVAGVIGVQIVKGIDQQRCKSGTERLRLELETCRRLALNMQADWRAVIETSGGRIFLRRFCPEMKQDAVFEWEFPLAMQWDNKRVESIAFLFASTGKVEPAGHLTLIGKNQVVEWVFPALFSLAEEKSDKIKRPKKI